MGVNQVIVWIMAGFMLLGAADRCLDGRFGLGKAFDEGISAMGGLMVPMVGFIAAAPVIGSLLAPLVGPGYQALGADPAMFAGTILSSDMGGYPLARTMALDPQAADFAGIIVGAMLGGDLCFAIPVILGFVREEDLADCSTGIMAGIITIPVGCFCGGLAAGFGAVMLLRNLFPILLLSAFLVLGLWRFPRKMVRGFLLFSRGVIILATAMFALAAFQQMTSVELLPGMAPAGEGILIVGSIGIVLAGAYPMVAVINRAFCRPLGRIGRALGVNAAACAGIVAMFANLLPVLPMVRSMDRRGKVMAMAFGVNAGAVFGDYLGFTAGTTPHMIAPMIIAKLAGGFCAILAVRVFFREPAESAAGELSGAGPV